MALTSSYVASARSMPHVCNTRPVKLSMSWMNVPFGGGLEDEAKDRVDWVSLGVLGRPIALALYRLGAFPLLDFRAL